MNNLFSLMKVHVTMSRTKLL